MPWQNKVIWSQGLFFRPHHLQQHDRYLEHFVDARCSNLLSFGWGFTEIEIDKNQLLLGKFSIISCKGLLSDGTPFNIPEDSPRPEPISISKNSSNEKIYLALPLKQNGTVETENADTKESLARFNPQEIEVKDNVAEHNSTVTLQVGSLRLQLLLDSDNRNHYSCLELARIQEFRPDKGIILDKTFLPTCLSCSANSQLNGFITEIQGLLERRSTVLSTRINLTNNGGVSEIADFLMLLLVNKSLPLMTHLNHIPSLHPEVFYRAAVQLAGELATFTTEDKFTPTFPAYNHNDLESSFTLLMGKLREYLNTITEQNALSILLKDDKHGTKIAAINDKNLISSAQFVLAVKADISQELLQINFMQQLKIAPIERIQQLINMGLPGIGLRLLPIAPQKIPFHAGCTYFELDKASEYWKELELSSSFALHLSGDFPGLQLEFWCIKG